MHYERTVPPRVLVLQLACMFVLSPCAFTLCESICNVGCTLWLCLWCVCVWYEVCTCKGARGFVIKKPCFVITCIIDIFSVYYGIFMWIHYILEDHLYSRYILSVFNRIPLEYTVFSGRSRNTEYINIFGDVLCLYFKCIHKASWNYSVQNICIVSVLCSVFSVGQCVFRSCAQNTYTIRYSIHLLNTLYSSVLRTGQGIYFKYIT